MLYLLGGASRSGKSKLARRVLSERGVPFLHLDLLMMGFARGLPAFGVDPDSPALRRGEQLWPVVRAMAVTFRGRLPVAPVRRRARAFLRWRGQGRLLGLRGGSARQKLRQIRAFGGESNDWVARLPDERVLEIVANNAAFSVRLREECAEYHLPYFDTSWGFPGALDAAFRTLVA